MTPFAEKLSELINQHSCENESNTPDFILASYLFGCLMNYNATLARRINWYGRDHSRGSIGSERPAPAIKPDYDTCVEVAARIWCDARYPLIMNVELCYHIGDLLYAESIAQAGREPHLLDGSLLITERVSAVVTHHTLTGILTKKANAGTLVLSVYDNADILKLRVSFDMIGVARTPEYIANGFEINRLKSGFDHRTNEVRLVLLRGEFVNTYAKVAYETARDSTRNSGELEQSTAAE